MEIPFVVSKSGIVKSSDDSWWYIHLPIYLNMLFWIIQWKQDKDGKYLIIFYSSHLLLPFFGLKYCCFAITKKGSRCGETLVKSLQNTKYPIDEKLEKSVISLFSWKPNGLSDATNNTKDMDDDIEYIHDKQYQTREGTSNGLSEKHVAGEMESSDEDADVKKGEKFAVLVFKKNMYIIIFVTIAYI